MQYANESSRFLNGVSTARRTTLFGNYPKPNPVAAMYYENDFTTYLASDWTVAPATGTTALAPNVLGGAVLQTTGAVSTNAQGNALASNAFQFVGGSAFGGQVWFSWAGLETASNVTAWLLGLTIGGANAPTSGVYFSRATASNAINFTINVGGVTTVLAAVATSVSATPMSLGFYYDGKPIPTLYIFSSTPLATPTQFGQPYYQGGVMVASMGAQSPSGSLLTNLPTAAITPSFAATTNAASAVTFQTDYIMAAQEIPTRF